MNEQRRVVITHTRMIDVNALWPKVVWLINFIHLMDSCLCHLNLWRYNIFIGTRWSISWCWHLRLEMKISYFRTYAFCSSCRYDVESHAYRVTRLLYFYISNGQYKLTRTKNDSFSAYTIIYRSFAGLCFCVWRWWSKWRNWSTVMFVSMSTVPATVYVLYIICVCFCVSWSFFPAQLPHEPYTNDRFFYRSTNPLFAKMNIILKLETHQTISHLY